MRYTTLIDIREIPEVYRNQNARLLYLHLVLLAGYHDNDRDIVRVSIRNLAIQTGLTLSATRHAISVLMKWRLLLHRKSYFKVVKFIDEQAITPRAKSKKAQQAKEIAALETVRQSNQERKEAAEKDVISEIYDQGKTPFMLWYEQKVQLANAGDVDAQRIVNEKRAQYEAHKSNLKNQIK